MITDIDLAVRHFVYRFFVQETRPPAVAETAAEFGLSLPETEAIYKKLHDGHFLFLEPGQSQIRMANPFSAVSTGFIVRTGAKSYYANCAWDMLGIPAMLHEDATISARFTGPGGVMRMAVKNGRIQDGQGLVHFPLPVRHWYDDLIHT